jgi:DNA-directed RNA polymerase subunit K/omega
MTKYEKARVIGTRALHLAKGAIALVKTDEIDALKIAQLELIAGVIPMVVQRQLPGGVVEEWKICDMIVT